MTFIATEQRARVSFSWVSVAALYLIPGAAVLAVILTGLWTVNDVLFGMYGNHDGHWASWNARAILQWGRFLDFSPFSPIIGTGGLFLPNLPWLNPGALALAVPGETGFKQFASYLVYLLELAPALFILYRSLALSSVEAFWAICIYFLLFFIPGVGWSGGLPWYALAPVNAHLTAMFALALAIWLRIGAATVLQNVVLLALMLLVVFSAYSSAPVTFFTYIPTYTTVGILALFAASRKDVVAWRVVSAVGVAVAFWGVGLFDYTIVTSDLSARSMIYPDILHPGWRLLTWEYWAGLIRIYSTCGEQQAYLLCLRAPVGWLQLFALLGGLASALLGKGNARPLGLSVVVLIAAIHFYFLLTYGFVLGKIHTISAPYLTWTLYPFLVAAVVKGFALIAERMPIRQRGIHSGAQLAIALTVAVLVWQGASWRIFRYQYTRGPAWGFELPPIGHIEPKKGPIHQRLEQAIRLEPGDTFRGYATTFLGGPGGYMRTRHAEPNGAFTMASYIAARQIFTDNFGHQFQNVDLWNSNIPTIEEYGQWVIKPMFYFLRDLLADQPGQVDALGASLQIYRYDSDLLRAMGVTYVLSDGVLQDERATERVAETGRDGGVVHLYELEGSNIGNYSPTQVVVTDGYRSAIEALRQRKGELRDMAVLMGQPEREIGTLTRSAATTMLAVKDGYVVKAKTSGTSLLVLPLQFSHCWRVSGPRAATAWVQRVNVVQTGIVFSGDLDARLTFEFQPWNGRCRKQDVVDMEQFGIK